MKKLNSKGIILLEAVVSISIFMMVIVGMGYIYEQVGSFDNRVNNVLSQMLSSKVTSSLEYIKNKSLALGKERSSEFSLTNTRYPGWSKLSVTKLIPSSINQLSGDYHLVSVDCPIGLSFCLEQVPANTYQDQLLTSDYSVSSDNGDIVQLTKNNRVSDGITCDGDYSDDCVGYFIRITNTVANKNTGNQEIELNGTTEVINNKQIELHVNSGKKEDRVTNYLLSLY